MLKLSIIANIALIVISILLTFKAFPIKKRRIINLLIIFVIAVPIFLVIYPNFVPIGSTSCNNLIEYEAESVSAAMASYFSEPDHTKLPTINDLEHCEGYIPPSKRKSPRIATNNVKESDNVKESELVVFTREKPNNEYEIWVVAGKGKCPAGVAYVKKMGGAKGEWYKSYEEK
jgi:hypothetical protein